MWAKKYDKYERYEKYEYEKYMQHLSANLVGMMTMKVPNKISSLKYYYRKILDSIQLQTS
jgi:hypothetical protein